MRRLRRSLFRQLVNLQGTSWLELKFAAMFNDRVAVDFLILIYGWRSVWAHGVGLCIFLTLGVCCQEVAEQKSTIFPSVSALS